MPPTSTSTFSMKMEEFSARMPADWNLSVARMRTPETCGPEEVPGQRGEKISVSETDQILFKHSAPCNYYIRIKNGRTSTVFKQRASTQYPVEELCSNNEPALNILWKNCVQTTSQHSISCNTFCIYIKAFGRAKVCSIAGMPEQIQTCREQ